VASQHHGVGEGTPRFRAASSQVRASAGLHEGGHLPTGNVAEPLALARCRRRHLGKLKAAEQASPRATSNGVEP